MLNHYVFISRWHDSGSIYITESAVTPGDVVIVNYKAFTLTENVVTKKGFIIAHYKRAGEVFPSEAAQTLIDKYLKS